jgi:P4 family phage/plasmid primase-like protien
MYKYEYKFTGSEWYMFRNHLWHKENDGMYLRQKISTDLLEKFILLMSDYNKICSSTDQNITEDDREEYKSKNKEITKICLNLKTTAFKDNIVKECKELFYDKNFANNLDTNFYLLGFNNGIYDLKTSVLRDGRPDDYVSMSTNIDKIDFNPDNEHWTDIKKFIDTVFFEEEVREYFLLFLASCLQGHNAEEKFRIWTGSGSNGKSKIMELLCHALGEYTIKFPVTMLTGKRAASNAATPEIVMAKGKRFGYFEEPSGNERINAGLLKEFSGGDKITARGLHKDPIEFKPQFKLSLLCNDIPEVPAHDTGISRRLEIIEFKSKFTENPKEMNEFHIDKSLSDKLPLWKELFIAYLLDIYYEKYKNAGIKVPAEVVKFTVDFQKQCDSYDDFISGFLEETKELTDFIGLNEIYDEFRIWYEDSFGNNKYPSKMEFSKYLKRKYPKNYVGKELRRFKKKNKNSIISHSNTNENLNAVATATENTNAIEISNSNSNGNLNENNTKKSKDGNIGY